MSQKINYSKTVEFNKLILQDRKFPLLSTKVGLIILIVVGGIFTIQIIKTQLRFNQDSSDYLIVVFVPLIYILLIVFAFKTIYNRTRLKEIQITLHREEAKLAILKAASDLSWQLFLISDNYLRFRTKSNFLTDIQTITIIFFPDNRVFFNSLNDPDDDLRPPRFEQNYSALTGKINHKC